MERFDRNRAYIVIQLLIGCYYSKYSKYRSTIIVFKGKNEIAREIGLGTKEDIYRIINKAI